MPAFMKSMVNLPTVYKTSSKTIKSKMAAKDNRAQHFEKKFRDLNIEQNEISNDLDNLMEDINNLKLIANKEAKTVGKAEAKAEAKDAKKAEKALAMVAKKVEKALAKEAKKAEKAEAKEAKKAEKAEAKKAKKAEKAEAKTKGNIKSSDKDDIIQSIMQSLK